MGRRWCDRRGRGVWSGTWKRVEVFVVVVVVVVDRRSLGFGGGKGARSGAGWCRSQWSGANLGAWVTWQRMEVEGGGGCGGFLSALMLPSRIFRQRL